MSSPVSMLFEERYIKPTKGYIIILGYGTNGYLPRFII